MSSSAASGVPRGWAVRRSVTLLRAFLLASAAILVPGAIILGSLLTTSLRNQALGDAGTALSQYADGVLRPELVRGDQIHVSPLLPQRIKQQLRRQPDIITVKVWRPDGILVWTNRAPERIGKRFSLEGDLGQTIAGGEAHASFSSLNGAEDAVERSVGIRHVLEVYAPVLSTDGTKAIGAYEIYANPKHTEAFIASRKRVIWFAVAAVFLTLYGALALFVRLASRTLHGQAASLRARSRELMDSYRR